MTNSKTIQVKQLARVEGDGGLLVKFRDGRPTLARFTITEQPRLFEAFLRGRHFTEVPDITARICGICPLAHMLSAGQAMENGLGLAVASQAHNLRRLLFLGEWIVSHSLHIFLLNAPDFFGCADALELSKRHPQMVRKGLRLKKTGNAIVRCVGGREVHPINLCIGGFYHYPLPSAVAALRKELVWALEAAVETVRWTAGFTFPDFESAYTFLALHHPKRYALLEGRLRSSAGDDLAIDQFERFVEEEQVPHSTALQAGSREHGACLVGPLARFNLNFDQLSPAAQAAALAVGLQPVCANPFKSIVVRSVELVHACQEALDLVDSYGTGSPAENVRPYATTGTGCIEAPRGLCWHRYRLDDTGDVLNARIIPPTTQNLKVIEEDLQAFAEAYRDLPTHGLRWKCEQLVRSYDPCISCACHRITV